MRKATPPALPLLALALVLAGCSACEDRAPTEGVTSAPSPSAADTTERAAVAAPPLPTPRRATPCRAITVDGEVRSEDDAGTAVGLSSGIALEAWIDLSPGARLVAKDPRTTRETTFRGPSRVRACVDSIEESWLDTGTFESNVGAGESPGAEEWVITPLGVVRFAAAKLGVQVSPHRRSRAPAAVKASAGPGKAPFFARESVRVTVTEGVAFVWAASDVIERGAEPHAESGVDDEGWRRVSDDTTVLALGAPTPSLDLARAAVSACETVGRSAHDLANALLSNDAGSQVAARQVATRRLARAACAVAALRVGALPDDEDPAARQTAAASLRDSLALWHELPQKP
jgi:hypothetical protein